MTYNVYLINFSNAATIDDHSAGGIRRCTPEDLDEEKRVVEGLLNDPPNEETVSFSLSLSLEDMTEVFLAKATH